jgi:hypothetical protein
MIRIAITEAAFEAIAATLPLGSVAYEPKLDWQGQRLVWLEANVGGSARRAQPSRRAGKSDS